MFGGLSAKERMAQLQAKSAKEAAPAKPPGPGVLKKVGKLNGATSKADDAAAKAKSPDNAKELVKAKEEEKTKLEANKEPAKPVADGVKKEEKPKEEPTTSPKESKKAEAKPAEETKPTETKKDDSKSTAAKKDDKPKTEKPKPKEEPPKEKEVKEEPKPKDESKKDKSPSKKTESTDSTTVKPEAKPAAATESVAKPKEEAPKKPEAKDEAKAKPTEAAPKKDTPKPTEDAKKTAEPAKTEKKPAEDKKETLKPKEEAKPVQIAKQKEEAPKSAAVESDKPKEQPKPAAEKPKEETKKPEVKEIPPAAKPTDEKPKDVPKPAAPAAASKSTEQPPKESTPKQETKTAEKPKEEAKKTAVAEAKPQPTAAVSDKPKEQPKSAAEKPKEETKKPEVRETAPAAKPTAAPTPEVKPAEAKKPETPAVTPESKPTETPKQKPVTDTNGEFKPTSDELFTAIFYFSGMGSLLGSALAEGVFVPERSRRTALDADEVEAVAKTAAVSSPHRRGDQVVATARNQAHILSNDFRQLQALLENLPSFGDKSPVDASLLPSASTVTKPVDRRAVEQPIHGHVYFQQPDRPHPAPQQQVQHHQPQQQQQPVQPVPAQTPSYQTPTAVAVHAADVELGSTVVQLASLHPPSSGGGRSRPAAGAVQVLPVAASPSPAPQTNFTSAIYRPPQPAVSRTPVNFDGVDGYDAAPYVKSHHQPPSQPWQERYGPEATGRSSSGPRPYGASAGGDVDSTGVKSWQLSHLRTLEAKGYRVAPPASVTPSPAVDDQLDGEVRSFAPYLVSDRTLNADRRQTFQRAAGPGSVSTTDGYLSSPAIGGHNRGPSPYQQQQQQPRPYRPPSGAGNYPFSPNADNSLPYCDL